MITVNKIDELLKYFHQELAYLRNKGLYLLKDRYNNVGQDNGAYTIKNGCA